MKNELVNMTKPVFLDIDDFLFELEETTDKWHFNGIFFSNAATKGH